MHTTSTQEHAQLGFAKVIALQTSNAGDCDESMLFSVGRAWEVIAIARKNADLKNILIDFWDL
jgi:hypothetical protein